jgi:hypothetical protein
VLEVILFGSGMVMVVATKNYSLARSFVAVVIINRILMFAWGNESKQDLNPTDVSRFTFIDNIKVIFSNPLHQQVSCLLVFQVLELMDSAYRYLASASWSQANFLIWILHPHQDRSGEAENIIGNPRVIMPVCNFARSERHDPHSQGICFGYDFSFLHITQSFS